MKRNQMLGHYVKGLKAKNIKLVYVIKLKIDALNNLMQFCLFKLDNNILKVLFKREVIWERVHLLHFKFI